MSSLIDEKERKLSADEIIVAGSTWAAIWHMSWPMLIQMLIVSAASFADVWVAGKLGSDTQAAIGICNQIWFMMLLMTVALSSGAMALISRFWGARDYKQAVVAGRQSLLFGIIFGVLSTLAGLLATKPLLAMSGVTPAVQELGWKFLSVDLLSQLPFTIVWTAHSMFRAIGNSRVPMLNWLAMAVVIITLDLVLALKCQLGIAGIGWAWLGGGLVGTALNLYLLSKSDLKESLNLFKDFELAPTIDWMKRILNIGIPTCVQDLAWVLGNFALYGIFSLTSNPTSSEAAWTIGFRLEEMLCTLPLHAIGCSLGTVVGQNLGAGRPDRAEKAGWQANTASLLIEIPTCILMFIFAEAIAAKMSNDAQVVKLTADYLRIVGLCQPLVASWIVLFGAMTGAGYTKWPMWVGIFCLTVVRLPLAYILVSQYKMGAQGIWVALAASASLVGIMAILRFRSGAWKNQEV